MHLGYARVSTAEQNLDLQLDALEKAGVGKEAIHVEKRSGAKRLHELEKVTALLQQGDSLTAWKLDRLGRSAPEVLATVRGLVERGVTVRTLKDAVVIDPGSGMGRFWLTMLAAQAELERDLMIERVKAGRQAARARGKHLGAARLYGFEAKPDEHGTFRVIQQEATIIEEVAARVLDQETLSAIVRDLRIRKIPTSRGKDWTITAVRRLLQNPRIQAIVGDAAYQGLLRVFSDAKYRQRLGRPAQHLLSGIVTCSCGQKMYVSSRSTFGNPCYRCFTNTKVGNCGRVQVSANELENYVTEATIKWLSGPGLATVRARIAAQDADLSRIQKQIQVDEQLLEDTAREAGSLGLSPTVLAAYIRPIEARLTANRARLKRAPALAVLADIPTTRKQLEKAWESWDINRQRQVLKAAITSLTVSPTQQRGPVFDVDRVKLTFVSDIPPFDRVYATEQANGNVINRVARDLTE
jgi:DNA invertase Pin-like site-specific DNA recombinase